MSLDATNWSPEILSFCKNLCPEKAIKLPFQKPIFIGIENSSLVSQSVSYRKIKDKIPTWWERGDLFLPDSIAAEQCTSEWVSRWKSTRIKSSKTVFIDACAGLGVDSWFLGKAFIQKILFEINEGRANALSRNLALLGFENFRVFQTEFLQSAIEGFPEISSSTFIYLDPDRRPAGHDRKSSWRDSTPDLEKIYYFLRPSGATLLVKLSPMDNLEDVLTHLPGPQELVTVSLQNEVKEVLIRWDFCGQPVEIKRVVVEIQKSGHYKELEIPELKMASFEFAQPTVEGYILDPWACLRKGNQSLNWMLNHGFIPISHGTELYFSKTKPIDFPGRIFKIQSIIGELNDFGKRTRKRPMQVICRNFPEKPEALKKKYLWTEGQLDFLFCYGDGRGKKFFIHAQKIDFQYSSDFWNDLTPN